MSDINFIHNYATVNELYERGLERKLREEEADRKRELEHEELMTSAWRARDFETEEAIPRELRKYLVPTEVSTFRLPQLDKYQRRVEIPEFAPLLINLVKERDIWRISGHSVSGQSIQSYLVCGSYLDDENEEVGYFENVAGYCGNDIEEALVVARDEYLRHEHFMLELEQLKEARKAQRNELEYIPADPPVPTDAQALEALKELISQLIDKKIKH